MYLLTRPRAKTWLLLLIGSLLLPATSHAFSLSDLFGGDDEEAASTLSNPLADLLSNQLDVSTEQAAGGAGALLSIAASQLGGEQATELTQMIPGLDSLTGSLPPGTSALLGNMDTINQVFSALGMDPSMVSQFIPVVMQFLGDQGASSSLMDNLGSIWQAAG